MGRKREAGNERLGQHVQRRSGGMLELRFPIPSDVAAAFIVSGRGASTYVIRSLGTKDIRLANAKADLLRTSIRQQISDARATRTSLTLAGYLDGLFDEELSRFQASLTSDARNDFGRTPVQREQRKERQGLVRADFARALLSEDPAERRVAAGWAGEEFYRRTGREPDGSPAYFETVDLCASTLVEAVIAANDIEAGKLARPRGEATRPAGLTHHNGLTANGELPISRYFTEVYLPMLRQSRTQKGERMLSGKDRAVSLFVDIVGDLTMAVITKGHMWAFHDGLMKLPDPRKLSGDARQLSPRKQIEALTSGAIIAGLLNPLTVNKHVSGVKTVLDFAEKRRDIETAPSSGVRAEVHAVEDTGRAFTTDELNRIFAQPLFAGCSEGLEPKGLQKSGPVRVRDDRFWIPLVLLFTGARSSEVVGLHLDDVVVDHEVPHFLIRSNSTRRIKNRQSKRMVPVHSKLIDMGFLGFANVQHARDHPRFFRLAEQQFYNEAVTGTRQPKALSNSPLMRQFNRTILADAGARENGGSVKCFRNTFEQEAAALIPSDEVRRRLTGRDLKSSVQIYTQNIPDDPMKRAGQLRMLSRELERVIYEGVDLTHLNTPASEP